jgi:peptidoglycan hydrolase-like protein with peptidoglycan-binding domain
MFKTFFRIFIVGVLAFGIFVPVFAEEKKPSKTFFFSFSNNKTTKTTTDDYVVASTTYFTSKKAYFYLFAPVTGKPSGNFTFETKTGFKKTLSSFKFLGSAFVVVDSEKRLSECEKGTFFTCSAVEKAAWAGSCQSVNTFSNTITCTGNALPADPNVLLKQLKDLLSQMQNLKSEISPGLNLTRTLSKGMSGDDVISLQFFLARSHEWYPEGVTSGYFGGLTEKAVMKYQTARGIEPIGIVGPKTRERLNADSAVLEKIKRPSSPTGLESSIVSSSKTTTTVGLKWDAPVNSQAPVTGYRIYRNNVAIGSTQATSYQDPNVPKGVVYIYTVTAYSGGETESEASPGATVYQIKP